jgi:hypothetical protein
LLRLQIKPDATSVTETSLSGIQHVFAFFSTPSAEIVGNVTKPCAHFSGVAPGLKFNFKGDDKDLGVLGVDYSIPNFAFTSKFTCT